MLRAQEVMLIVQRLQRGVPGVEEAVAQVLRVHQAPLPPAVRVAPAVALPALATRVFRTELLLAAAVAALFRQRCDSGAVRVLDGI